MNLGHIITRTDVGGAQVWVRDQLVLFEDLDIKQIVISNQKGWLSDVASNSADFFFVKKIESFFSFFAFFEIFGLLRDNKVDTIIASSASAGVYARLYGLFNRNVKVIYVSHGWSCIYNGRLLSKFFTLIERILSTITDKIICVSNQDYINAKNIIKIKDDKLVTIRNAVFHSKVNYDNILDGNLKLLFVGRLTHPKRFDLLVEAVSTMQFVQLDIIGTIFEDISHLEHYDHIRFLGEVPGFNGFSNYNCFILISDSEGLPMSALEAASSGLPLILSDVGGCSELIFQSNGLLVDNNVESIRFALISIIENYSKFKKSAVNNINNVSIFELKNDYENVYFNR